MAINRLMQPTQKTSFSIPKTTPTALPVQPRTLAPVGTSTLKLGAGQTGGKTVPTPLPGSNQTYQPTQIPAGNQQLNPVANPNASLITPTTATKSNLPDDSYQGLVRRIASSSQQSSDQRRLLDQLEATAAGNKAIADNARAISEKYGNEINRVGGLGAGAVAGDLSTGTNVVGSGNAAIASQSASSRMQALGNAQQAELQGTQQQLTGQSQAANAYGTAIGAANTQQQQQISGLGSAAGYAQPQVAGYGQTAFDPLTSQFGGGQGNLEPQAVASQLADDVIAGRKTYDQAVSALGYAGGAGQQFLNQAIQGINPNFNVPQSQATIGGQTGVLGQLPQMQAADTAAEGIKNKIDTYLDSNPGLNASNAAIGNLAQQWLQGKQLADPKYQTLFNYLNEYTSTLAPILGVGGDTTNLKTEIAQSFVNAAASGQSIREVIQNIQNLSKGKIQDLRSGASGGGTVSSSTGGSSFAEQW